MPVFSYKAVAPDGSEISGKSTAATKANAIQALSDGGYAVFDIAEGSNTGQIPWYQRQLFQNSQLNDTETAELCLTLAAMLERHLPLVEALSIASETASAARIRQSLRQVQDLLTAGAAVEDAFSSVDGVFPEEFLILVKAGTASNALSQTFNEAAQYFKRRTEVRQGIWGAAAYPLFLILAAVIVFGIILFSLIPTLYATIASTGGDEAGTISSMYWLSLWLKTNWVICLAILLFVLASALLLRRHLGRALGWVFPAIRRHQATFFYARAARILSILVSSGERLDDALTKTARLLDGHTLSEPLNDALDAIRRGEFASAHFQKDERVPALFSRFFELGERSNNLPSLLLLAAESLEKSHAATLKRLVSVFTPVLTLIVGGIIALVVQVLISAVLEISQVAI